MHIKRNIYRQVLVTAMTLMFVMVSNVMGMTKEIIEHELDLTLDLAGQTVEIIDKMTLTTGTDQWPQSFNLTSQATIQDVLVDQRPVKFTFIQGHLKILSTPLGAKNVTIQYHARFNDPVPEQTIGIEDPSYGIHATITQAGVFLSQSANWTLHAEGYLGQYRIRFDGPAGLVAVTNGAFIAIETLGDRTLTTWESQRPQQGLTLVAGFYQVKQKTIGSIQVFTFLTTENASLADRYLSACVDYLEFYQKLFGSYPYAKFAVVENFFPTGYGLPGWTLLGSSVIRLPFILTSSLPHEIAHAWWGNAVEVDYAQGNWCEGLATYVADYLLKERSSAEEAVEYRLKLLRDYASLVEPEAAYPLRKFRSRTSKRDQAIGYGKTAMVYHMLRQRIGDQAFWQGLQRIAREESGKRISWAVLKQHFSAASSQNLDDFFKQWIEWTGAPTISLEDIETERTDEGWQVRGKILQQEPFYKLALPISLEHGTTRTNKTVNISGRMTAFTLTVPNEPTRLNVDPGADIFRNLAPEEIPPTINALRASSKQLIVITEDVSQELVAASQDLLRGLHWTSAEVIRESQLTNDQIKGNDLLFIGWPKSVTLLQSLPGFVAGNKLSFSVGDRMYRQADDSMFLTLHKPDGQPGTIGIFHPLSAEAARMTARKISHYGRYSYLAFSAGRNQTKGTWPITKSPLIFNF